MGDWLRFFGRTSNYLTLLDATNSSSCCELVFLCVCPLSSTTTTPYNHYILTFYRKIQKKKKKNVWEFWLSFYLTFGSRKKPKWFNLVAIRIHSDPYHIDPLSPNRLSSGSMGRWSCHPHMCPNSSRAQRIVFFCFVFYFLRPDENGLPFHEITGSTSTLSLSTMVWKNCQVNRRQTRKRNQHAILYTLKKRKASADIQFQHKSFWNIIFTCIFIWDRQKKKKRKERELNI